MRRTRRARVPVRRPTGLYVHSNPPTVLPVNASTLRQWLRGGEIDRLAEMVHDGEGQRLLGEYSPDPKARAFLRTVPAALVRIDMAHEAVDKGDLRELEVLLESGLGQRVRAERSRDPVSGLGLMHKAILHDHTNIFNFLLERYPASMHVRDKANRTPLHYVPVCSEPEDTWKRLLEAGADPTVIDTTGYTAAFYMNHPRQISLPRHQQPQRKGSLCHRSSMHIKPATIRIWIHDRDIGRLQEIVWEGFGDRLRTETSSHPVVKRFLNAVPYIMGIIKEVHLAAVTNDLELLNRKIGPPVPSDILRSKDGNGLTPLHKAVGLGYLDLAKEMALKSPNALRAADPDGRTPLHYAAMLKGQDEIYEALIASGASADIKDSKGKVAAYYKGRASEIDPRLLRVVPDAPRTAHIYPPSWDWKLLHANEDQTAAETPSNADSAFEDIAPEVFNEQRAAGNDETEDESLEAELGAIPDDSQINGPSILREGTNTRDGGQQTREMKQTAGVTHENGVVPVGQGEDVEDEVGNDNSKSEDMMADSLEGSELAGGQVDMENLGDDGDDEATDDERSSVVTYIEDNRAEPVMQVGEDDHYKAEDGLEGNYTKGEVQEDIVNGEAQEEEQNITGGTGGAKDRGSIQDMVDSGNMEKMAELVLEGDGHMLLGHITTNPDVQLFLNNVPQYMAKIETVHRAAREGDLRTVQATLDRRKFAVAKDNSTPLKATPLHVATLFGRTAVLRYLAGRFPETMHAQDAEGRTALHYAATLPDNGHFFSLLVTLGADRGITDKEGNTAEHYLRNPGQLTHFALLSQYQGRTNKLSGFNVNQYSDKVPNDTVSSRRDLDDDTVLEQLDKCFELIHNDTGKGTLLQKFLTENIFEVLKYRCTKNNNTLLDLIRPGVRSIVLGTTGSPEITIPDAESFRLFPELLMPVLKAYNGLDRRIVLDPHPESGFFEGEKQREVLEDLDLDPSGRVVRGCVVECSRNLERVPFPDTLRLSGLERVEGALTSALTLYYKKGSLGYVDDAGANNGVYYSVNEILDNPDFLSELREENLVAAGLDGEEHYGRGVFIGPLGEVTAWLNIRDHVTIIASTLEDKRGHIGEAYTTMANILEHLQEKFKFAWDPYLGHLSSDPTLVGTALKFSVLLSLTNVNEYRSSLEELCRAQNLVIQSTASSELYKLQNKTCLGLSEIESLKNFIASVSSIIDTEKKFIRTSVVRIPNMIKTFLRNKSKKRFSN